MMQLATDIKIRNTGNFLLIMKMAVPIIIQGLVFQLQAIVDKAFLGKLDTEFLSAVGVAQFPFFMTADVLMALCTGMTIIVSQLYGAGKLKEIHENVNASIAFTVLISWFLFCVWFFFPERIFDLMNVNPSLMVYCNQYVRFLSFMFLLYGIDISLQVTLQGMGKTKQIMYIGLIKVTLNIVLAWILVFGKLGFPALHVRGAALATAISGITGTLILIIYFITSKELSPNLNLREILRFRWSRYRNIVKLGFPTGSEYFLWNASNLVLISFLNEQGVVAVAIFTLTFAIELIVLMFYTGIARATLTLVGHRIGAGDYQGARSIMNSSIRYSLYFVITFFFIFALFPKPILSVFSNDKELIHMSVFYLMVRAVLMFPRAMNVVVGHGIRAIGDVKWMLYTQVFGSIFVVAFSYCLIYGFHIGVFAIYLTMFFDEFLRATLNTIRFYKGNIFIKLWRRLFRGVGEKSLE